MLYIINQANNVEMLLVPHSSTNARVFALSPLALHSIPTFLVYDLRHQFYSQELKIHDNKKNETINCSGPLEFVSHKKKVYKKFHLIFNLASAIGSDKLLLSKKFILWCDMCDGYKNFLAFFFALQTLVFCRLMFVQFRSIPNIIFSLCCSFRL